MSRETPSEMLVIPIDRLFVDYSYHRQPNARLVSRIAHAPDPTLVRPLVVRYRPDYEPPISRWRRWGRKLLFWRDYRYYSVVDGVHRLKAAEHVGAWSELPCLVEGDEESEATLFAKMNTRTRRGNHEVT